MSQTLAISQVFAHKVRAGTVLAHRPALTITRKDRAMAAKPIPELTPEVQARFWAKVDRRGPDECWEWRGGKGRNGYGHFQLGGTMRLAHRIALWSRRKAESLELLALHSCDNRACCNPSHLRWGTNKDNVADAIVRGKRGVFYGETHHSAKVTAAQVAEMRSLIGTMTQRKMAERFGLSEATVSQIVTGRNWKAVAAKSHQEQSQ